MKKVHADIYRVQSLAEGSKEYLVARVYADRIDILRSRARLLKGRDRAIMVMYLDKGNTITQIARVAGLTEPVISRRIHRLMARLIDSEFIVCRQHRDLFEPLEIDIAKDFFLVGMTQGDIAANRDISIYMVRKIIAKLRAFKKKYLKDKEPKCLTIISKDPSHGRARLRKK